jgi:hypothetical protein
MNADNVSAHTSITDRVVIISIFLAPSQLSIWQNGPMTRRFMVKIISKLKMNVPLAGEQPATCDRETATIT